MEGNQGNTSFKEKSMRSVGVHHKSTPYDDGRINYEELTAIKNGKELGRLTYYWDGDGKYWKIEDIEVKTGSRGIGMSKLLLGNFVQRVGFEAPIQSIIVHQPTLDLIADKQQLATPESSYVISPDLTQNLPIMKILKSGGIDIHKAVISYDQEDDGTTLTIFGTTHKALDIQ